ncbi:MAG TPA: Holliday junction resolvase-like protein [Nitrospira sp.]|nr:Holliday junction resolvase-like protein [Nitrospira sp.]
MLAKVLDVIFGVGFLVFLLGFILLLAGRKPKNTGVPLNVDLAELPRLEVVPEGFERVSTEWLNEQREKLLESQRLLGEERERHKQEMVTVQSNAITEMQQYKASLDLEFAERKRSDAKITAARSRTALVAKIAEHLAPILPGFPYNFKECRWFGEIFDFLVFENLEAGPDSDINVVFVEVKTRRSGGRVTNPREKQLRAAIESGRVRYEIFIPDVSEAKQVEADG